jgi:hypothetical protein
MPGIEFSRLIDHRGGHIESPDRNARIMQVASDVPRTAAHVADLVRLGNSRSKAVEQLAIERFVLQFIEDATRVLLGNSIVAFADGVG